MNQLNNNFNPKGKKGIFKKNTFLLFFCFSSHCFGSGTLVLVMQTQMVAESPNLYIANLLKEQQESKDFVRCICMDNNQKRGRAELLQKNWKTILYLLDEAQFVDADTPPKLDLRMEELAKKKSDHPAVKAYQRYRSCKNKSRSIHYTRERGVQLTGYTDHQNR